jgi:cysteine synthase A
MNPLNSFTKSLDQDLLRAYPALDDYLLRLGETPLLEVPGPGKGGRVFAKAEWANPNGTVKDRVAFALLYQRLCETPPRERSALRLLEYSGGSLAKALAALCADLRIPLALMLPDSTNPTVLAALTGLGTEVLLSPAGEGFWGVVQRVRQVAEERPDYSLLLQGWNPANTWVHRETTGREIVAQLPRSAVYGPCAWVATVGTGGTLAGVYQALSEAIPHVQLYLTSPAELPYGTDAPPNSRPRFLGAGGFGHGRRQPFVAPLEGRIVRHYRVGYSEALAGVREFHTLTGLRLGSSAAANWLAARDVAARLGPGSMVVTVFPCACPEFEAGTLA